MKRVTGLGGIFFKSREPKKLLAWSQQHLGLPQAEGDSVVFEWGEAAEPSRRGQTVWSHFPSRLGTSIPVALPS